jgi:hypothetical protein
MAKKHRYLVSWEQRTQSGHKHIYLDSAWSSSKDTEIVMSFIMEAFNLDSLPVINSVFYMGEHTQEQQQ